MSESSRSSPLVIFSESEEVGWGLELRSTEFWIGKGSGLCRPPILSGVVGSVDFDK